MPAKSMRQDRGDLSDIIILILIAIFAGLIALLGFLRNTFGLAGVYVFGMVLLAIAVGLARAVWGLRGIGFIALMLACGVIPAVLLTWWAPSLSGAGVLGFAGLCAIGVNGAGILIATFIQRALRSGRVPRRGAARPKPEAQEIEPTE